MYFLSSDGSVKSYSDEQSFGWWIRDFDITEQKTKKKCEYCVSSIKDVQMQQVQSVDRPNVSQEIATKCKQCDGLDVFVPAMDNLTELINKGNSRQMLLVALVKPTLWNAKYQEEYNKKYDVTNMKHNKFKSGSTLRIHKTNDRNLINFSEAKTRFHPNDSMCHLLSKLGKIKKLLNNIKEEMIEMRNSLKNLKRDFAQDEEHIKNIIDQTTCFTHGVYDSKYLDNIILLLNEDLSRASLENWPFWSKTSITYSGIERNYIV